MKFFPEFSTFVEVLGYSIQWYAVLIISGAILAYNLAKREFIKKGYDKNIVDDFFFNVLIIGVIGCRIWYILFNLDYFLRYPLEMINLRSGGLAIHGGLLAGAIYGYYYFKKKNINVLEAFDYIAPYILIAQAIGRWGNFFNKEVYGYAVERVFLERMFLPNFIIENMYINGEYHQPTFLYESVLCLLGLYLIIFIIKKISDRKGTLFFSYLIWYGIIRFIIEGMRMDNLLIHGFRTAQIVSVAFIILGIAGIIYNFKRKDNLVIMFDLDGTLIDTNKLIIETHKHVFATYKKDFVLTDETAAKFIGPSLHQVFTEYIPEHDVAELIEFYREYNIKLHPNYVSIYDTVKETLDTLKKNKYKIGLVTTKKKDVAILGLNMFGIRDYFEIIIGNDEVNVVKPSPEGILKCLNYFNSKQGIYIGDNGLDIEAAKSANEQLSKDKGFVKAVGVGYAYKGVEPLEKADKILDKMIDLIEYIKEVRGGLK